LGERSGIHIANKNRPAFAHQTRRELMQGVFPAVGDLRVDRAHSALLARALRGCKLGLKSAIELRGLKLLPGAGRGEILEP
jgi:hypothetical protein